MEDYTDLPSAQKQFLVNHKYANYENSKPIPVSDSHGEQLADTPRRNRRSKSKAVRRANRDSGDSSNGNSQINLNKKKD